MVGGFCARRGAYGAGGAEDDGVFGSFAGEGAGAVVKGVAVPYLNKGDHKKASFKNMHTHVEIGKAAGGVASSEHTLRRGNHRQIISVHDANIVEVFNVPLPQRYLEEGGRRGGAHATAFQFPFTIPGLTRPNARRVKSTPSPSPNAPRPPRRARNLHALAGVQLKPRRRKRRRSGPGQRRRPYRERAVIGNGKSGGETAREQRRRRDD
nr:hypothetical protein Iba_chr05fCG16130 [Ipomoea batatas]